MGDIRMNEIEELAINTKKMLERSRYVLWNEWVKCINNLDKIIALSGEDSLK